MIIWLASYPRSGNRYFRTLLRYYYGIGGTTIYPKTDNPVPKSPEELHSMMASAETFLVKTHELPQDDAPAIYLVRDGRDALISYTHFILRVEHASQDFETILQDVVTNPGYFGGWGNHVLAWTRRPYPTAVVKFEELTQTQQPIPLLQRALQIVGHPCIDLVRLDAPPTFQQLQQKQPLLLHRGKSGYWKTEMPPQLYQEFWRIHGEAMRHLGYLEGMPQ